MKAYKTILADWKPPVLTISFNRPDAMNALSPLMEGDLLDALFLADQSPEIRRSGLDRLRLGVLFRIQHLAWSWR